VDPLKHRDDIDGLRALAVIPVILFHAKVPGFTGGFIGVDVFFVISGYLITRLIWQEMEENRFSLARFYERRIRRIMPALLLVVLATLAAGWFFMMPAEYAGLGLSAAATVLSVSNFFFWDDASYFSVTAELKPLLHSWSLSVEEQFYLLFPLGLVALRRWSPKNVRLWLALAAGISFVTSAAIVVDWPDAAFYAPWFRAWELLLGGLLALSTVRNTMAAPAREALGAAGAGLIVAPVLLYSEALPFPGALALAPCAGTAMIIHAGGVGGSTVNRLLSARLPVAIGLISYSLYLWHWPILVFFKQLMGRELTGAEVAAALALMTAVSALTWRYVEQPFRQSRTISRRAVFSSALAGVLLLAAAGVAINAAQGVPLRLPERVNEILAKAEDRRPYLVPPCLIFEGKGPSSEDIRSGRLCSLGAPEGPITFLFMGDSHAGAMAPGVDAAAKRHNVRGLFLGHASCPPIVGYQRSAEAKHAACKISNAAALDLIQAEKIPLVLMTARWARYVNGTVYGNEGPYFDPRVPIETDDQTAMIAPLLRSTIDAMQLRGARPVLIGDVPEVGYDVGFVMARAALLGEPRDIRPKADAVAARQALSNSVLDAAAAAQGVTLLKPERLFCGPEYCDVERNGELLYRDEDHLSDAGALFVSPLFDDIFAEIAGK